MNRSEYLDKLKDSLTRYFDIELDKTLCGKMFSLYGRYYTKNSKYFALKNIEIYSFTVNEYILYNNYNTVTVESINELMDYIKNNIDDIVIRDKDYMSSNITFLISSENSIDKDTIKAVKNFKFYKSYNLGLKGWVNVKLILIDLKTNQAYSNALGRREKKRFILLK
ncbi:MAG: hypothetical protein SA378_05800 [Sedimentibacter sp.]|uniref:hypothetical protein n=1 Tax=Sedimentibacter sp. TaxID=1960295 RepID=UPI0029820100|nr:hypothetical protein [Sedimentibacter sp.]MDW5299635.1 hypothetical protein [Sedimentibacter sp.]